MNKTCHNFILSCLALLVSCFVFISPVNAQEINDPAFCPGGNCQATTYQEGIVGPCSAEVYMQLQDVAQMNAELSKKVLESATDEKDDPSIISLSCLEADLTRYLDDAQDILTSGDIAGALGNLANTFIAGAKQQVTNQLKAAAGKFACENVKNFIQNQIDQCFDFNLIERQAIGRLGNQACIIDARANVTINRHGYAYTGISANGSIRGPGGLNESVLLGANAVEALEGLYTNWRDDARTYTQEVQGCGRLDPSLVARYDRDYFVNLEIENATRPVNQLPEGVNNEGDINGDGFDDFEYTNVGTYAVTNSDGSTRQVPYENNAECYGYDAPTLYAPCGTNDVTGEPLPCQLFCETNPDAQECLDQSCCNLETEDCARSGINTICPCSQGNAAARDSGTCSVGVPTCCDGTLNDCTQFVNPNTGFPYEGTAPFTDWCEGTAPEDEEIDCEVEFDNVIDKFTLTPEQVVDRCPVDYVTALRFDMALHCLEFNIIGSGCKQEDFCRRRLLGPCTVDENKEIDYIAAQCQVFVVNQDIVYNIPEDIQEACEFDFTEFGPYVTPTFIPGEDNPDIPTPTPTPTPGSSCEQVRDQCLNSGGTSSQCDAVYYPCLYGGGGGSGGGGGANNQQIAPANTAPVPSATIPTPAPVATPTQTPSAGSGGGSSGGSLIDRLF